MCIEKADAKQKLSELISRYNSSLRMENHANISEETIRTWLNEFLGIFGWDVQNTNQILQERVLIGRHRQRLQEIQSPHIKPDYILLNGSIIKSFIDAKSLDVNIFADTDTAYQIRSYGWSAQAPCAFVSNFEQLVIYDTRFIPQPGQPAHMGANQLFIDDYIENFDVIFEHLWHDYICSNHLDELYAVTVVEGRNKVDSQFMNILSSFRKELAENLYSNNPAIIQTDVSLNFYTQVILDRIVFIRVCESKGIEEQEKLKHFAQSPEGFWNAFKNSCYMEFYNHYDGVMFTRDESFQQLQLNNGNLVEFVNKLYYPFPYRFDVIPVKVIANIYEEFLGKQLVVENGAVIETTKEEYIRSNGAVATPEHIVDMICKQTLDLNDVNTINELLNIKILDPACGCGSFLVTAAKQMHSKYGLTYMEILNNYIFGVDIDENAIRKTKLLLTLLACQNGEFETCEYNLYCSDMLNKKTITKLKQKCPDGFNCVIGNPPYVRSRNMSEQAKQFFKDWDTASTGNVDLYIPFFEIGLSILSPNGILGYITPNGYIQGVNGRGLRNYLIHQNFPIRIIDFRDAQIFKKVTSYTCITIIDTQKEENSIYYARINEDNTLDNHQYSKYEANTILHGAPWRMRKDSIDEIIHKLENAGEPLSKWKIRNGLATLKNDLFFFTPNKEDEKYYYRTYDGMDYTIEKSICINVAKPNIIKNEQELSEKSEKAIFPYTKESGKHVIIEESVLANEYPKAYEFLCTQKNVLERRDKGKGNYTAWYAYGRTQGMNNFGKKLLIPYIAGSPIAVLALDENLLFYCGYALFSKDEKELRILKAFLESDAFWYYIYHTSKPYSKGYMAFAKNYIVNFTIPNLNAAETKYLLSNHPRAAMNALIWRKYGINPLEL